jgi:hypothetical protein
MEVRDFVCLQRRLFNHDVTQSFSVTLPFLSDGKVSALFEKQTGDPEAESIRAEIRTDLSFRKFFFSTFVSTDEPHFFELGSYDLSSITTEAGLLFSKDQLAELTVKLRKQLGTSLLNGSAMLGYEKQSIYGSFRAKLFRPKQSFTLDLYQKERFGKISALIMGTLCTTGLNLCADWGHFALREAELIIHTDIKQIGWTVSASTLQQCLRISALRKMGNFENGAMLTFRYVEEKVDFLACLASKWRMDRQMSIKSIVRSDLAALGEVKIRYGEFLKMKFMGRISKENPKSVFGAEFTVDLTKNKADV